MCFTFAQPEVVSQSLGPVTEVGGSTDQAYSAPLPTDQSQPEQGGLTLLDVSTQIIDGGETVIDGGVSETIIGGGLSAAGGQEQSYTAPQVSGGAQ